MRRRSLLRIAMQAERNDLALQLDRTRAEQQRSVAEAELAKQKATLPHLHP
jgi:hypothetical protein